MPTIYKAPVQKAKTSMKALAYFAVNPDGVRFETQEEKEDVVLFLRQHPIVNVPWIIGAIVMLIAPTVLFPFIFSFLPIAGALPVGYMIVGTVFWYVATFGFILGNFLYWFFNIYIVTNERVVDIDFLYLLYKRFSQAELTKIQDISYASGGVLATIFDYGNVTIETAGEAPNLEFEKVPHPQKVVETIRSVAGLGNK
ncbi:MAG: PH domain-containing protein [Patescibacteria group bacterium]